MGPYEYRFLPRMRPDLCKHGYDADSTAAVAGGLAGLYYGYNSIPAEWVNALAAKEIIEECIQSLENRLSKEGAF